MSSVDSSVDCGVDSGVDSGVESKHAADSAAHPRGAGFRVLSRLARRKAEEEPGYLPRHRSDAEPDDVSAVG
jgi:hypothetical protein